jgi:hypothetical protein
MILLSAVADKLSDCVSLGLQAEPRPAQIVGSVLI